MIRKTIVIKDRNYEAWIEGEQRIIIGPPEELVDNLHLPEPFATRLHNVLHARGFLNYSNVQHRSKELIGALQEALLVDAQMIAQEYFQFSQEAPHD